MRILAGIIISLLACVPAYGQRKVFHAQNTIPGSWPTNPTHLFFRDSNGNGTGGGTCSGTGSTCIVNVSGISANDSLVCFGQSDGASKTLNSCTGETWIACATACQAHQNGVGNVDARYVIRAAGGETTVTCTWSGTASTYQGCGVLDFGNWSGSLVAIDQSGSATNAACTSCAGPSLTLAGSIDACFMSALPAVTAITAVSAPYATNAQFYGGNGMSGANGITTSPQQATWTQASQGIAMNGLCFKGS